MTSSVQQAQQALGLRLRDLRKDANLTGLQLAGLAGWRHSSKVTKIELGKQKPTDDDIRAWCRHTGAEGHVADLIATARHIDAMYTEWRRNLGTGTKRRQNASRTLEAKTKLMRWYEPVLIPGLLHTAEYATAVMRRVIDFYGIPDDLEAGVEARMQRQRILYRGGDRRFHFLIAQQALTTTVGDDEVMIGQLDRLLAVMSLPRIYLGIIPADAEYRVPTHNFIMYDRRIVHIENISAEVTINQPREIALHDRVFTELASQAATGTTARNLINTALDQRRHKQQTAGGT
ncbi:helix-turn-helix domain-containing protein [Amycolatopsis lurida]